ncbi:MAG TPA: 50S ribosomal protein L29 [Polyangiaceae bacterium]|jgi:large subunit ribosomal protein L29|nr:MAG: 50S ribosomal protein L29 [Deltaproteobacteria bacterium ADurb.Bin207]HNS95426.1 50S ribosomal protein L29 [Polyangiaceae bacterium]HNZ20634.1 50S ribosomal protein L29 [Polyangiaceae bacterium]HOD20750.1 50S ribosomal protein L29 [Polyangiaceae bacterium]HOE47170.1 50S ribosomal protein L29 [Polyangiaceae bacterium]
MKAKDLRDRGTDDLRELDKRLTHDLFQYRFKNHTGGLDDTSLVRKTRRDIARVRTELAARERAAKDEAR